MWPMAPLACKHTSELNLDTVYTVYPAFRVPE